MKAIHWRVVRNGVVYAACMDRPLDSVKRRIKSSAGMNEVTCYGCLKHVERELTRTIEGEDREETR